MTSTLAPLAPPEIATAPATTFGDKPEMRWLPLSALRVDEAYQRPITPRGRHTIERIAAAFSWSKFQAVIVAPVEGQTLWTIIDGQHRCLAATLCGIREVPCMVVDVQSSEAAKIFAAVNTVTPMTILALFKASRIAGEGWAVEVDSVCKAAGIEPLVYPVSKKNMKPLQTLAIGTIRREIARFGAETVTAALIAERKRDGASTPGYFDSTAIAQAVTRHRGVVSVKPVAAPVVVVPSADIPSRIRALKGRGYSRQAIASALRVTYADIEAALAGEAA